jgi:flagellar biogenesis protein FliO
LGDATMRRSGWAIFAGAISAVLALIGFLRWVFVVPPLARLYQEGDAATRTAVAAASTIG